MTDVIQDKYQGIRGAVELTDVRRHTREADTRYTQRVAYFMNFNEVHEAADRVEALASGAAGQSDPGEKTPEELYRSAVDLGNVLKDIANVLRSFPGYKASIERGEKKIVEMEERLGRLERVQTSVLTELEAYLKSGEDKIERQTGVIKDQVDYLKEQMRSVRSDVSGNRTETFEYLGKIFTRMEGLTAETGRFMEVVTNLSKGMPHAIARRLDDLQQKVDRSLSSSNLTDVVENSLIRLSQKKISLIDAGWQTITSLTDVESLKKLKQTAESIEKNMASLDKVYGKLEEIRRDIGAAGRNSETVTRSLITDIEELGNNIVSEGKNTRHTTVRAVARADIKNKGRFAEAYKRIDELKERIVGLEGRIVASFEGALDSAMAKYKAMGLSEQEAGQIREVMVGGVMKALETHEGYFDKSFREFSESIDRKGVKMDPAEKSEVLGAVRSVSDRVDKLDGYVRVKIAGLEERLMAGTVTEGKVREISREESGKRVVSAINGLNFGERIDNWMKNVATEAAQHAVDGLSKKVEEAASKAAEQAVSKAATEKPKKPKPAKPEGEIKPGEEKVTVVRKRLSKEEEATLDVDKILDKYLGE